MKIHFETDNNVKYIDTSKVKSTLNFLPSSKTCVSTSINGCNESEVAPALFCSEKNVIDFITENKKADLSNICKPLRYNPCLSDVIPYGNGKCTDVSKLAGLQKLVQRLS